MERGEADSLSQKGERKMTRKYEVEFTDNRTGATSPIDTIEAEAGYTAEQYIKDCRENADPEWVEMLEAGEVHLVEIEEV